MRFTSPVKKVKFCGVDVEIRKLSGAAVFKLQESSEKARESKSSEDNTAVMHDTLRAGCAEMESFTAEQFMELPLDELNNLVSEILKFSGMGTEVGN